MPGRSFAWVLALVFSPLAFQWFAMNGPDWIQAGWATNPSGDDFHPLMVAAWLVWAVFAGVMASAPLNGWYEGWF